MTKPQRVARRSAEDWWSGETHIRIPQIARHVVPQNDGRPVTAATCWRWTLHGLDGVRIRRFRSAGCWATTIEEVQRWLAALTALHAGREVTQ